jgi:hypothetical protein
MLADLCSMLADLCSMLADLCSMLAELSIMKTISWRLDGLEFNLIYLFQSTRCYLFTDCIFILKQRQHEFRTGILHIQ